MKKAIMSISALLIFISGFSQPVFNTVNKPIPADFQFLETTYKGPLFQLKINNTEEAEYLIKVRDADQNLLYSGTVKGKNISRTYIVEVVPADLYDQFKVQVEVISVLTRQKQIFNITNQSRNVNDIIIAKL